MSVILSGLEIEKRNGMDLIIDPYDCRQLNPNSYNMKLHNELLVYESEVLDMKKDNPAQKIIIPDTGFILKPGELYLGRTVEFTRTTINRAGPNLVTFIDGRSSIGRLGINVHATAGYGDIGFGGYYTLEISCLKPVVIYPWIEICQIYFMEVEGECFPYKGKYQYNHGIQSSMLYKELE